MMSRQFQRLTPVLLMAAFGLLVVSVILQGIMCAILLFHKPMKVLITNREVPVNVENYDLDVNITNGEVPVTVENDPIPVTIVK